MEGRDPERTAQRGARTVRMLRACPMRTGPAALGTQVSESAHPGAGLGTYRPVKRCSCSGWSTHGLGEGRRSQSLFPCCLISPSTRLTQPATGPPVPGFECESRKRNLRFSKISFFGSALKSVVKKGIDVQKYTQKKAVP